MPISISETQLSEIRKRAKAEGFDDLGVTSPTDPAIAIFATDLKSYLDDGRHGDMDWLAAEPRLSRRLDPHTLWPECHSILMLAMNYAPVHDPLAAQDQGENGIISCYAQGRDYHDVVKKALKRLGRWMVDRFDCEIKVFVDTAPVMEKPLAELSGIGWQGKHSNLVSRELGSWFFLGAIYTDLDLPMDQAHEPACGSCRACMDICPTDAIVKEGQVDARRCISYLTIEHAGPIPIQFRKAIGNRIYGCDDCLAVCPWNKFAQSAGEERLRAREELINPPLAELATLDDAMFRARFRGTAIKRLGRDRFIRNVLVAIGNSGNSELAERARELLNDPAPIVRASAVWALRQLISNEDLEALAQTYLPEETDENVRREWE